MKKLLPLVMLLMTGAVVAPARADLTHRMSSSTQLSVNGAYTDASRIGSTYTVSGSNIKVADSAHFGKMTAATATAAAVAVPAVSLPKWASVATLILDPETV